MQRTSPAAITEGARLWGPFLTSNPHCAPPKGVLLIPGYKSHRRQDCSPLLPSRRKKKSRFMGPEGGAKNVCVCVCVCVLCTSTHTYIDAHLCIHTRTHGTTPALGGWDHTWEREVYPLTPRFMDHYRGFVSVAGVFFDKTDNWMKKTPMNGSGFWRPWLVQKRAAKGLGILRLHFWAGMPNLCVSPSSGWKPVCGAGALGSLQSQ